MVVHLVIVVAIPYCSCPLPWILAESFGSRNFKTRWLPWLRQAISFFHLAVGSTPKEAPMPGKKKFIFIHYVVLNIGGGPQSHVPVASLSGATFLSIPNSAKIYVNFALSLITLRRRNFLRHHSRPLVVQSRVVPFLCTHATGHCVLDKRCHLNRKSTCFSIQIP